MRATDNPIPVIETRLLRLCLAHELDAAWTTRPEKALFTPLKLLMLLILVLIAALSQATAAIIIDGPDLTIAVDTGSAAPIPGLFNTGVDAQGHPLPDNANDLHYRLVAGSAIPGVPLAVNASGGFPIGPWLPDSQHSAW